MGLIYLIIDLLIYHQNQPSKDRQIYHRPMDPLLRIQCFQVCQTWMSQEVSKWVITPMYPIYKLVITHLLTIY